MKHEANIDIKGDLRVRKRFQGKIDNSSGHIRSGGFYTVGGDLNFDVRSMTVVEPRRNDKLTWFVAEQDIEVTRLNSWLDALDTGFYPQIDFTVRYGSQPEQGTGTELSIGGFSVGFYPGNADDPGNPIVERSFDNPNISDGQFVWIDIKKIGEGGGIERELHVSLQTRKS